MGWDKGRYYTRTRRVGKRFVREYIGGGVAGRRAAEEVRRRREWKAARRAREGRRRERFEARRSVSLQLDDALGLLIRVQRLL